MPKPFDATSKHLFETRPRDWLELAGFPVPESASDVSIVDADLSSVVSTAADKLIRVDNPPSRIGSYFAHIEFQSSADAALDARVHLYNVLSRRRHGLPVWSAVFLLRPQALTSSVTGSIEGQLDSVSRIYFSYHLVRVWELPPSTILNAGIGVLPLAPITAVEAVELPPLISAVKQRLAREVPAQKGKEFLLAMRLLMGLKYQEQFTEALMQSIAEMTDSVEWQKIFRSGKLEGEAEGKAKGKAEGLVEGERRLLIRQGTSRFGPPDAQVLKKLASFSSPADFEQAAVKILTASSWDELFNG